MGKKIFGIILIIIIAVFIAVTVIPNFIGEKAPEEPVPPEDESPAPPQYEDAIIVYGDAIPVDKEVDTNEYDPSLFIYSDDGRISYDSDNSADGIDVSGFQGEIAWQQVANSGIEFAFIRLGYRGYESGSLNMDSYFEANMEGALEAGIQVGVYFFSQAITPEEAAEEAQYVLDAIEGYEVTYPVIFDWEYITGGEPARTDSLTAGEVTECAVSFCDTIEEAGHYAGVYFNTDLGYTEYEIGQIDHYELWLAEYAEKPDFYYDFNIWQYSNTGSVPGIEGNVDLNICFNDYSK